METANKLTTALVLGGGGVTGIGWELGILLALQEAGVDITQADVIIGTSAGSVVGSQVAGGTSLADLFASQLVPVEQSQEQKVDFDANQFQQRIMGIIQEVGMNPAAIRAGIGKMALENTAPEAPRRQIIASRLPVQDWPQRRLLLTAVDTADGEPVVFDRNSGVALVDAVAASCAVPGVWPSVTINGKRYMDGGVRSSNNADLAAGYNRVLILSPIPPEAVGLGGGIQAEIAQIEAQGGQALVISPDAAALQAIGPNVLDPAYRASSAQAGQRQGQDLAASVRQFWTGAA